MSLLILLAVTYPVTAAPEQGGPLPFTGVNLSGGDFDNPQPGKATIYGQNYIYPQTSDMDYFASKGVNIIRFPFRWEDLQPNLQKPLDKATLDRIKEVVTEATKRNLVVLLDPHNYARYYGKTVGSPDVSDAAFADFWSQLASQFKGNKHVWFGLMNEPYGIPPTQWLGSANAAIVAIRKTGAKNMILVPGIAFTGAHSWIESGNADAMLHIKDPQNHYIFDVHQYFDQDSSGTKPEAVSATIGSERLAAFTAWCRQHHQRGFLGEFGTADNPTSALAVEDMLSYMEKNRDVWVGYTWWAAGPWWGDYMYSVEPKDGVDSPLMRYLTPHLQQISPSRESQKARG